METVVGLLHPGEMGAALGAALRARGREVLWASGGRSENTAKRAASAGLRDTVTVNELVAECQILLSVCPPHAALDVATNVAATGFSGVFVDANAISPATSRAVGDRVAAGGATYVDGGIIGQPPSAAAETRLYLSGDVPHEVADLFYGTPVKATVLAGPVGEASALKMTFAAWTKGTAALLLSVQAAARAHGVEAALLEEWAASIPELANRSRGAARSAATKGWRWVSEMEEIATTLAAVEVPAGFHEAAAEVFRRSPHLEAEAVDENILDSVLTAILRPTSTAP
jgi:3-hydroxyisobutyrate dehydrogenase-like beta-hydroxyacid dehydrogenase